MPKSQGGIILEVKINREIRNYAKNNILCMPL